MEQSPIKEEQEVVFLHPTPPCKQERSPMPTAALWSPCTSPAGMQVSFLDHLNSAFPPAAFL